MNIRTIQCSQGQNEEKHVSIDWMFIHQDQTYGGPPVDTPYLLLSEKKGRLLEATCRQPSREDLSGWKVYDN